MKHADLTPKGDCLPIFLEGSEVLPLPIFVTVETDGLSKKALWKKIGKTTEEQRKNNRPETLKQRNLQRLSTT